MSYFFDHPKPMMLFFLLGQSELSVPTPPPHSGLVALFSSDDYPREAIRNGWQGTVQVELIVNPEGRVADCRIVRSSGYAVLDEKTCDIMRVRAKFTPAKDSNGRPVEDLVRSPPIMWRLPR